jgi:hypothetical protein
MILSSGVYKTSYATEAYYDGRSEQAWDIRYKQSTPIAYLRQRIRTATNRDKPITHAYNSFAGDRGCRQEIRGVWFDRSGKRKVKKV